MELNKKIIIAPNVFDMLMHTSKHAIDNTEEHHYIFVGQEKAQICSIFGLNEVDGGININKFEDYESNEHLDGIRDVGIGTVSSEGSINVYYYNKESKEIIKVNDVFIQKRNGQLCEIEKYIEEQEDIER